MSVEYLGYSQGELEINGGINTATEIVQQPELWNLIFEEYSRVYYPLNDFINRALTESDRIILTGAGTSAFIGLSLKNTFVKNRKLCTSAIPTTDIVSHPKEFFFHDEIIMLVSFARSGNSPESIGTVEFADKFCKKVFHIIISCAENGQLAHYKSKNPTYTFLLPSMANDKGLAMTSSYTGMLLAGILMAEKKRLSKKEKSVELLCKYGKSIIDEHWGEFKRVAQKDFTRAVFLGSGEMYGVAKESHLKLQELTDGHVVCKYDTFLGFRHGPKAVVDENTLMFYLFSSDTYAHRYEKDLIDSMNNGKKPMSEMGVSEYKMDDILIENQIFLNDDRTLDELGPYLQVCFILPAQIIGLCKSIHIGMSPDSPSKSGAISRVVEGVKLYPVEL